MKRLIEKIKLYRVIIYSVSIVFLIVIGILGIVLAKGAKSMPDQTIAFRWSEADDYSQISAFFPTSAAMGEMDVEQFRYSIEKALGTENIEAKTTSARLYVDTYYATGTITVSSEKSNATALAYGVGGDFFLFHPLELVSGGYFSGDDLMQDSIIVDEQTAWTLFGSSDIAGMLVTINGVPHRIGGVYKRSDDKLSTLAGLDGPTIFVSFKTLSDNIPEPPIEMYEVCMPNPVKNFAYQTFTGEEGMLNGMDAICVENSARFTYRNYGSLLKNHSLRRMKTDSVVLPFWENLARVKEDRLMWVALTQWILLGIVGLFWFGYILYRITQINIKKLIKREEESFYD